MLTFIAITAEEFATQGDAWVKAIAGLLNSVIGQVGILGLAAIGVWKSLSGKADLKERLDRQGERIDNIALAVPATTNGNGVKIDNAAVEIRPETEATTNGHNEEVTSDQ
jgi:hypothetical protein